MDNQILSAIIIFGGTALLIALMSYLATRKREITFLCQLSQGLTDLSSAFPYPPKVIFHAAFWYSLLRISRISNFAPKALATFSRVGKDARP